MKFPFRVRKIFKPKPVSVLRPEDEASPASQPAVPAVGHDRQPSAEEVVEAARSLAYVRPLVPYPGWRFDADWENPDPVFRMRRELWSHCLEQGWDLPVELPWHDGLRVCVHLANDLSKQVFIAGCIDPNEFAFLDRMLAPGMTFVDAGANEGLYTLFASGRVGPCGQVWAFEPSSREFDRLGANVRLNGLANVCLSQIALADENSEAELLIADPEHSGQNTLGGFVYQGVREARRERVTLTRLDDLAEEARLSRIDVVKIDVEGAEERLLHGALGVLRRYRPVLLIEVLEDSLLWQDADRRGLTGLLRSLHYSLLTFQVSTGLPGQIAGSEVEGNVVAVPSERPLPPEVFQLSAYYRQRPPAP